MKRLFIIDGHALIFKMYYAFLNRPMVNSKGVDTSILFGFTKFLLELVKRESPTHIAVAFDPPAKTFRHELYPEYKANRGPAPELVKSSLEPLTEIVKSLDIPVLMYPGFEADDIIGSLARKAEKEGFEVMMVTPDKDLGQLVTEHIRQYKPGKGGSDHEIVDRKAICDHYGIDDPLQVIDILTLWGDASDNVPGVRGVGEKGAGKFIGKYKSVEGIYEHIDDLTPKQREAFEEAKGHIMQSKFLVTVKTDIELDITEKELRNNVCASAAFSILARHYEMTSLLNILPPAPEDEGGLFDMPLFDNVAGAVESEMVDIAALTEAATKEGRIAIVAGSREDVAVACGRKCSEENAACFKTILENKAIVKCGYNLKSLLKTLQKADITVDGELFDIEIMHSVINPERSHRLDMLAESYLGISLEKEAEKGQEAVQGDLFSAVADPMEADNDRAKREAAAIFDLYEPILEEMEKSGVAKLYREIEMPLIKVLTETELAGVKLDVRQLHLYEHGLESKLAEITAQIREMAEEPDLNIASTRQLGHVLYEKLNLDPKAKKNRNNNWPTDEKTLSALAHLHPIIDKILEYRSLSKLLNTYIKPLPDYISPEDGKIHTTYTQAMTATGRLSSKDPNLQNIPIRTALGREVRKAFVPSMEGGCIVSADYSQIELRVLAHLSGDNALIGDFLKGEDIHAATASKIFKIPIGEVSKEQRRMAKTANFGIVYGISAFGLSQGLGISRNEAKELIDKYYQSYPGIKSYMDGVLEKARSEGFTETAFGRRRYLPDILSRNPNVRAIAERTAINAPVQGTAADIIKIAMVKVTKRMKAEGLKSKMMLQVHDELVFDVARGEKEKVMEIAVGEMENVCNFAVPLTAECNYGDNWLEAH